jgi:hypothetical protein
MGPMIFFTQNFDKREINNSAKFIKIQDTINPIYEILIKILFSKYVPTNAVQSNFGQSRDRFPC